MSQIAEDAIRRAETSLREAENYVGREGRQALSQALEALKQFGKQSQQMTEIAQRAANESLKLVTFHSFLFFFKQQSLFRKSNNFSVPDGSQGKFLELFI